MGRGLLLACALLECWRGTSRGTYTPRLCKRCGKYKDKVVNHGEGKCEQ
jgi:hypothetical protein